jgi:hypothetical protein
VLKLDLILSFEGIDKDLVSFEQYFSYYIIALVENFWRGGQSSSFY